MRDRVFVVAEIGVNHNGRLRTALRLADRVAKAGADALKFQAFKSSELVSGAAPLAEYQARNMKRAAGAQLDMLRSLELSYGDLKRLKAHCDAIGLPALATPFDFESADFLDGLIDAFKIGSGEVTNLPFLRHVAAKGKPVLLSTGMSTLKEIATAVAAIRECRPAGSRRSPPLTLLQCTTSYPCPFEDVNLRAMETLKGAFGVPVGFSDHTPGIEASVAAAALGAAVIEKHFTLDRDLPGPDHKASLEPDEFQRLVAAIRNVESALGDGVKRVMPSERPNLAVARKSLVAARDIRKSESITEGMISIKRPAGGIPPGDLKKAVGMRARRDIPRDTVLVWADLSRRRDAR